MSAALAWIWPLALARASEMAGRVDVLAGALIATSLFLIGSLFIANVYFIIRYRRGSPAPRPPLRISSSRLESVWITGTAAGFLVFYFWGAKLYLRIEQPPPGATVIDVTARQWMWDIQQPNGRREFDTLHVPLGTPILLRLTSEDVIHSFFVPALRLKQDIVPGRTVSMWFDADRTGEFAIFCAQYCGSQHSRMRGVLIVQPPGAYAAWLAAGAVPGAANRGRQLFVRYGCAGCHTPGSSVHAPALEGVYGHRIPVAGGGFVMADESYLIDCILQTGKAVPAGYAPLMPSFRGVVSQADLLDLVAYIKSLSTAGPPLEGGSAQRWP